MKMISKILLAGVAAVSAVASANAATVLRNDAYTPEIQAEYVPYLTGYITFDADTTPYTQTGGIVVPAGSPDVPSLYAAPATSPSTKDETTYYAAQPAAGILSGFGTQRYVSLLWGSIDDYNTLEFLDSMGNVVGSVEGMVVGPPANGDTGSGATNRRVLIDAGADFTQLRLTTGLQAFEVDNVAFLSSVPEPASWAMMVGGFGLMGAALRRKRATALFA